ncbi:MAG: ketopantoate reductase family protein, partial [Methanomicrobium sp.]|nr:ketopantoate reductase family protein [Methanomicrobium sp.]
MMPPAKFRKGKDTAVNSDVFCQNSRNPKALPRVLVLGAGAVGLSFAGKISEVCEVYVVCRERHSAAIKKRGLFMEGVWGERRVTGMSVFSSFAELSAAIAAKEAGDKQCGSCGNRDTDGTCGNAERFGFDYIFITSKSSDTGDICREYSSLFAGAVLVSLQNGIGNEEILQSYAAEINAVAQNPADRPDTCGKGSLRAPCAVFGATITTNFRSPADGCVMVMSESEPLKIGVYPGNRTADAGSLRRLSEIVSLISRSGIKVESAENIRSAIWEKSLLNIAVNPLTALFQTRVGSVSDENLR